jgi:hypothetical protein
MKRLIYGALASISSLLMAIALPLGARAATTVTVTPQQMNGWMFVDDTNDSTTTASGHMVTGPANPPAGIGSAELETTSSTDGQMLMKNAYAGSKFTDLTTLTYSTYVKSGNSTVAPALQFSVDKDVTDGVNNWQGRIVFEPYLNGTVSDGQWQDWSAADGNWWLTKPSAFNDMCPQSSPCTLSQLTTAFSNIGVNGGVNAQILLKAGSGWPSDFVGDADALTVAFSNAQATTYDFEPYSTPSTMNQCKNSGYKDVRDNNGQEFKNQGQCVSWVQHNVNGNGQGQTQSANTTNNTNNTNAGSF